jgi:hypothetical protein
VVEKTRGKHGPERQPQNPENGESSELEPCGGSNRGFAEETEQDPTATYISFKTRQRRKKKTYIGSKTRMLKTEVSIANLSSESIELAELSPSGKRELRSSSPSCGTLRAKFFKESMNFEAP